MNPTGPTFERGAGASAAGSLTFQKLFDGRRWSRVPRQSIFLITAWPIALTVPVVVICLVSVGAGLIVVGLGVVFLLSAAFVARWFGALELRRLVWAGATPISPPTWPRLSEGSRMRYLQSVLLDARQWSYVVFSILYLLLGTVSGSLTVVWFASILNGATRWLWNGWVPQQELVALTWMPPVIAGPLTVLAYALLGGLALITLPWFTGTMVEVHDRIARVFLGRYSPKEIDAQMAGLERSRQAGVAAEGRTLRKLERDLHDGPQQQLLRLQLDLASARRKLSTDPDAAARLLDEAGRRSADTLTELRHMVRGIAPPILQDRGLAAALRALGERNAIPTSVSIVLDSSMEIEPAVQQGIYFVVSELLTNAIKHSGAAHADVALVADDATRMIAITVSDDGRGGATPLPGHGLLGMAERVDGLGGTLNIESPVGGPTIVTIHVPA